MRSSAWIDPLTDFEYVDGDCIMLKHKNTQNLGPQEYESKNSIYYSYRLRLIGKFDNERYDLVWTAQATGYR